jgi:hypothetical protein
MFSYQIDKFPTIKPYLTPAEIPIFEESKGSAVFWALKENEVTGRTNFNFSSYFRSKNSVKVLPLEWTSYKPAFNEIFHVVGLVNNIIEFRTGSMKVFLLNCSVELGILIRKEEFQILKDIKNYKKQPVALECVIIADREDSTKPNWLMFTGKKIKLVV